jgi:hypothetical protein
VSGDQAPADLTDVEAMILQVCADNEAAQAHRPRDGLCPQSVNFRLPNSRRIPVREMAAIMVGLVGRGLLRKYRQTLPDGSKTSRRYRLTDQGTTAHLAYRQRQVKSGG